MLLSITGKALDQSGWRNGFWDRLQPWQRTIFPTHVNEILGTVLLFRLQGLTFVCGWRCAYRHAVETAQVLMCTSTTFWRLNILFQLLDWFCLIFVVAFLLVFYVCFQFASHQINIKSCQQIFFLYPKIWCKENAKMSHIPFSLLLHKCWKAEWTNNLQCLFSNLHLMFME